MKKPIAITAGEPAGIGYDIIVQAAQKNRSASPWLVFADPEVLRQRALALNIPLTIQLFSGFDQITSFDGALTVWPTPCAEAVIPGQLNARNAASVLEGLTASANMCLRHETSALLTLPVHKGIINQSGIPFSGHTEFFAALTRTPKVVMMLASRKCRVALVTTHIPLSEVSAAITEQNIRETISIITTHLKHVHGCVNPTILVAGLNPHAGEQGHLGKEEQNIIEPTLQALREELSANIVGPLPADTLFQETYLTQADVIVAMYHDQGLAPLKAMYFGEIVNITCGLPFIRTSVDHGVALDRAATGKASSKSFLYALAVTEEMIELFK